MPKRELNILFILQGCQQGNRSSQRKLYEHFYGYGMSICLRYAKNREEAVEIMNDAFLKVFNNLDKYEPEYPFTSWLRRIIVNSAIDYHRKYHKISGELFVPLDCISDEVEEAGMPVIQIEDDLLPVLQKLPRGYRLVFNLFVMEEYKHHEIAEMLGISVSTSRSNFVRAKMKLREIILNEKGWQQAKKKKSWKIF